jgi:hypothetical protein
MSGAQTWQRRVARWLADWLVLFAASFALVLPTELLTVCDPAQCVREAQHLDVQGESLAGNTSDHTDADGDCGSPFHVCHCCAHVQVLPLRQSLGIGAPRFAGLQPTAAAGDVALSGHRARLFRPPS